MSKKWKDLTGELWCEIDSLDLSTPQWELYTRGRSVREINTICRGMFARIGKYLKYIKFRGNVDCVSHVLELCPMLKKIDMRLWTWEDCQISQLNHGHGGLEELSIVVKDNVDSDAVSDIFESHRQLKSLRIIRHNTDLPNINGIDWLALNPLNLQTFDIDRCIVDSNTTLLEVRMHEYSIIRSQ